MLNNNYQTYELLKDSDLTFGTILDEAQKEVVLTESNYSIYIESKDRRVRKDAFQTLYQTYKQFINSFASTLSGNINENITIARIKKYNSTIEWCLYHDELDETIYNNLINTVSNNMNILYKYYSLKKEMLKLDELHLYDIYTPIVKNFDKKYPYEEAKETVLKALSILGEDYISTLAKGLENNWVDVYPSLSKRTGAIQEALMTQLLIFSLTIKKNMMTCQLYPMKQVTQCIVITPEKIIRTNMEIILSLLPK